MNQRQRNSKNFDDGGRKVSTTKNLESVNLDISSF